MAKDNLRGIEEYISFENINVDNLVEYLKKMETDKLNEAKINLDNLNGLNISKKFKIIAEYENISNHIVVDYVRNNAIDTEFIGDKMAALRYTQTRILFKDKSECLIKNNCFSSKLVPFKIDLLNIKKEIK